MSDKTKESIICDNCDKELIVNNNYPSAYYLELSVRDGQRSTSGTQFAVIQYPPLDEAKHFCNMDCLSQWAKRTV